MSRLIFIVSLMLILAACAEDSAPKSDITLEPSQIAANFRVTLTPSPVATETSTPAPETTSEPTEEVIEIVAEATEEVTQEITPTEAITAATAEPAETPQAQATSNFAELKALQTNSDLLMTMQMDETCFAAGDFIPFTLEIINVSSNPIYFYKNGLWMLSINNSSPGPRLSAQEPQLRSDFVNLAPNSSFVREEDDLGIWVQGLGPESGISFTPTGFGLPAGDYYVTFIYSNDKNGLTEQPDGTYLIDRAAWLGTTVASEKRFRVVEDVSECQ